MIFTLDHLQISISLSKEAMSRGSASASNADDAFRVFLKEDDILDVLSSFNRLCESVGLPEPRHHASVYKMLKSAVQTVEAVKLWKLLDERAAHSEYGTPDGRVCRNKTVRKNGFCVNWNVCWGLTLPFYFLETGVLLDVNSNVCWVLTLGLFFLLFLRTVSSVKVAVANTSFGQVSFRTGFNFYIISCSKLTNSEYSLTIWHNHPFLNKPT